MRTMAHRHPDNARPRKTPRAGSGEAGVEACFTFPSRGACAQQQTEAAREEGLV